MPDPHFIADALPLLLALGIFVAAWFLPISRRDFAVAFVAALAGVVVPVGLTLIGADDLAYEYGHTTLNMILFAVPVLAAPCTVAAVEALRGRRVSWRGDVAGLAFVSIYATSLLAHYRHNEAPVGLSGAVLLLGWVLAPAAIVAVAYSLGAWKDDKVREARERAAGSR